MRTFDAITAAFVLAFIALALTGHVMEAGLGAFLIGATREVGGYHTRDAGDGGPNSRIINAILSPAQVNTITAVEQTFAVPEVLATDVFLFSNKPTTNAGVIMGQGRVSAANQVALTFVNPTAGNVTPTASQEYIIGIGTARGA